MLEKEITNHNDLKKRKNPLFKRAIIISWFVTAILWTSIEVLTIWKETTLSWLSCKNNSSEKTPKWFRQKELCAEISTKELWFIQELKNRINAVLWTAEKELIEMWFEIIEFSNNETKNYYSEEYIVEKLDTLSNIDWKIKELIVSLWSKIDLSIIDILKYKIYNNENFKFLITYSNPRDILDFLNSLKSENIDLEKVKKYIKFIKISKNISNDIWYRDSIFPIEKQEEVWFIISSSIDMNSIYNAWMISKTTNKKFTNIFEFFDKWSWWNIIDDGENVFIWVDTMIRWFAKIKLESESGPLKINQEFLLEATEFYKNLFNRKLVIVWEVDKEQIIYETRDLYKIFYQDIYHLDLFMTPLWDKKIAFAKPVNLWMENIAKKLKEDWYTIYEIPFIWWWELWALSVSYNNVLVEKDKSGSYVYVPQYSNNWNLNELWKNRDLEAIEYWKKTGFNVIPIRVDLESPKWWWSLHCRMREISRTKK